MQEGCDPPSDTMGSPLGLQRRSGGARRGEKLAGGFCGALIEMRADLDELTAACGFKKWKHIQNPCF